MQRSIKSGKIKDSGLATSLTILGAVANTKNSNRILKGQHENRTSSYTHSSPRCYLSPPAGWFG